MKVLNKRTDSIPKEAIYVGRPSKWGNPFRLNTLTHQQAVDGYRNWLASSTKGQGLMKDIGQLAGKDLVCWCAPLPCHADVLLELANKPTTSKE